MYYRAPRGTRDILPDEAIKWQHLESVFRTLCNIYSFGEIRTPIFEQTELFKRSVGEESDIVSKEMYSFQDRKGRDLTLRPELTAPVVRAYLENNLKDTLQPVRLFYYGPMFRYDRPQAGRYRQFHQMGLEIFGAEHPAADVEVISFCHDFFKALNIGDITTEINSVGCPGCRPDYRAHLIPYLEKNDETFCNDCLSRYKTNPMRVFDCKNEPCRAIMKNAPLMADYLCEDCTGHFNKVKEYLENTGVPFRLNPNLVRGLDYYTHTAFEIISTKLGSQGSLCGGGRYNNLVETCGGPKTPGVGVAFGVERLLLSMDWKKVRPEAVNSVYIAAAGDNLEGEALILASELRKIELSVELEILQRSLKAQLKHAARKAYRFVIIIGEKELSEGAVILRDMDKGSQTELKRDELLSALVNNESDQPSGNVMHCSTQGERDESEEGSLKTHNCGQLGIENIDRTVHLAGWVAKRREHGGLLFLDLRDRSGIVQLVFNEQSDRKLFSEAEKLRNEFVIAIEGTVIKRAPGNENNLMPTGKIEVRVKAMTLLNKSKTPPFYIEDNINVEENLRLKYRYLDLRRPEMYNRLVMRHRVISLIRNYLDMNGFLDIETPMLTRSTPEGARDFLIPSRLKPGSFYAMPQSPQLFKQLLMVSGVERYYQIARCFRDEDLRADRQPEFTQLDIETSFWKVEKLYAFTETLMTRLWREIAGIELKGLFPRIAYHEAMNRFGSDKPDTRFELELVDLSEIAAESDFKVFKSVLEANGVVKGIVVPGAGNYSRKELDELADYASQLGAGGLAWMIREDSGWRSPISKFFDPSLMDRIAEKTKCQIGDLILLVADSWEVSCKVLGGLRLHLAPADISDQPHFLWVTDFPLFHFDDEQGRLVSDHHPFTAPAIEDLDLLESNPLKVRAQAYDLVLNGVEIGGGSTRIHQKEMQSKIFSLLGLSEKESLEKFGFLVEALSYGAPPHGGIALGLDRVTALLTGDESIRQVIPFPKTAAANCLMTGAPDVVNKEQLNDLHLRLMDKDK